MLWPWSSIDLWCKAHFNHPLTRQLHLGPSWVMPSVRVSWYAGKITCVWDVYMLHKHGVHRCHAPFCFLALLIYVQKHVGLVSSSSPPCKLLLFWCLIKYPHLDWAESGGGMCCWLLEWRELHEQSIFCLELVQVAVVKPVLTQSQTETSSAWLCAVVECYLCQGHRRGAETCGSHGERQHNLFQTWCSISMQ